MAPDTLQGSLATYAMCGWIHNNHFTANFLKNLPTKSFENRLTFDVIRGTSLLCTFFWPTLYRLQLK